MDTYRVADRPQNFDMVRWDGTTEAAAWIAERWPEDASFGGEENDQRLVMYGSWDIERGSYVVDRQGSFHHVAPEYVNQSYQLAKSTNIPTEEAPA